MADSDSPDAQSQPDPAPLPDSETRPDSEMRPDPETLRLLAVELATGAATSALEQRAHLTMGVNNETVQTKSSSSDLVTVVDTANEALIVNALAELRPGDGVLGEEGTTRASTTGVEWIIDPIDGTTSFVHGYPGWSVSIAAAVGGAVVAGAVADPTHVGASPDPATDAISVYSAARGQGAWRDEVRLRASSCDDVRQALVGTGFSFDRDTRRRQCLVLAHVLPQIRDIRRAGSAALDLCHAAAGKADAFFEIGLNPWDVHAGLLIAEEAGAVCRWDTSTDPTFTFVAAPGIASELEQLLVIAGAELRNQPTPEN